MKSDHVRITDYYNLIINNIDEAFVFTDLNGEINYLSPNISALFDLSVDEAKNIKHINQLIGKIHLKKFTTAHEVVNLPLKILNKQQDLIYLLINIRQVKLKQNMFLYTIRDISNISFMEHRFAEACRVAKVGCLEMDRLGNITWISKELAIILHLNNTDEFDFEVGLRSYICSENIVEYERKVKYILLKNKEFSLRVNLCIPNQNTKQVFLSCKPYFDQYGMLVKILGTVLDVTEITSINYKLQKTLEDIIHSVSLVVEKRDPYTAGHQLQVAVLAREIGIELGMASQQIQGLYYGGVVHDVGKISIPESILVKPTKLSHAEYEIIKEHPQVGYDILKNIDFPWQLQEMVYQHHERLNGSGYPNGLMGNQISLEARVIAVADVVDSMCSHRPYRAALGVDAAISEIQSNSGTLYDPLVVRACITVLKAQHRLSKNSMI